jgi:hypothetical protein
MRKTSVYEKLPGIFRSVRVWRVAILALLFIILGTDCTAARAQTETETEAPKPIPVLTGGAAFLSNVTNGQPQLLTVASPVLLAPLGDNFLIESRGKLQEVFQKSDSAGWYRSASTEGLDYLQVDYIASPYVTISAGRFLTPFGMFNERMLPFWIRCLQNTPLIFPIGTGSGDGAMVRGGIPSGKANINYAVYFSALSTNPVLKSNRTAGGRVGFFLPRSRLEVGASFQQLLQQDRSRSVGFHFAWQPNSLPMNLRSEYAWSALQGSGFWMESDYRLSQIPHGRKFEVVTRAQQFLAGKLPYLTARNEGLPNSNTFQMDFGLNYYFRDGVKATTSYGRQFTLPQDSNIWTAGISYRFVVPMGPKDVR